MDRKETPEERKLKSGYDPEQDKLFYYRLIKDEKLNSVIISLDKYLGESPHSKVYMGRMVGSNRTVSIKIDTRPLMEGDNYDAIQNKVNALKELRHPAISELIDFIPLWDEDISVIIMQYIDGAALSQKLIDNNRPFQQSQVLDWALQLLDALNYLHKNQHIAGNISPSNIVLDEQERVHMVDFRYITEIKGVVLEKPPKITEYKQDNFGKYTDHLELSAGIKKDIYHLGETLFELLTNKTPTKISPERMDNKLRDELYKNHVTPSIADIILKAMSPDIDQRYSSAQDMENALRDLPRNDPAPMSRGL